jgi:hypothetical protein
MPPLLCTRLAADGAALCLEAQPPTRPTRLTREDAPSHEKTTEIRRQVGPQEETGWGTAPTRAHATALAQEGSSADQLKCRSRLILTNQPPRCFTDRNRPDRAPSPTESHRSLSVASHQPAISAPVALARPPNSRNPAARRRSRPTAASATPVPSGIAGASAAVSAALPPSSSAGVVAASSAAGAGSGSGSIPAASGHPQHVSPYASALAVRNWSGPVHEQLEGPGMPVARSVTAHAVALTRPGVDGAAGGAGAIGPGGAGGGGGMMMDVIDGADDGAEADDGRLYCWCQMGSFGDMVACDDNECEREWVSPVHISELLQSHVLTSYSSTWDVSDSRWLPRACGFVMRVGANPRIGVRSRGRPRRAGATAVRTGILVRHVRPPQLETFLQPEFHPMMPQCHFDFLYSFTVPISRIVSDVVAPSKNQWEGSGTYNVFTLREAMGQQ